MRNPHSLNLLLLSTPVAPLGSGGGGGVELTIQNLSEEMKSRGHSVEIVAPAGSVSLHASVHCLPGELQQPAQQSLQLAGENQDVIRSASTIPAVPIPDPPMPVAPIPGVLENMCRFALENQNRYDLIVSFAYDLLPIQMTPSFRTPLAHFISMCSLPDTIDPEVSLLGKSFPGRLGCYSNVQADTFSAPDLFSALGFGLDLSRYRFCGKPDSYLVWTGRISPEKGLEDAIMAANRSGRQLTVIGRVDDESYFQGLKNRYNCDNIRFTGFLSTEEMQKVMRRAKALILTPKWTEAFGIVAIEALACGVPVISYAAGGPCEIIDPGKTGILVTRNSIGGLVDAIGEVAGLDRKKCRRAAEEKYALSHWGDHMEKWFREIVTNSR